MILQKLDSYKKLRLPTHNIANKGFSGMRGFVARFNFSCTLIENHPQSLTGHIVKRCSAFKETTWTQRTSLKNFS